MKIEYNESERLEALKLLKDIAMFNLELQFTKEMAKKRNKN
jgi:hypothetical protein